MDVSLLGAILLTTLHNYYLFDWWNKTVAEIPFKIAVTNDFPANFS